VEENNLKIPKKCERELIVPILNLGNSRRKNTTNEMGKTPT